MKKIIFLFLVFLSFNICVNANGREEVIFFKCVDGDTIKIEVDGEIKTVRMLAVDTPESVHPTKGVEYFGKEASNFTCDTFTNAKKVEIEYDKDSDKEDKYGRLLVWLFVDDSLFQDMLVKDGYAEVAYLYGDYKYTNLLKDHQVVAETKKIGIWNEEARESYNSLNDIKEDVENVDDNYSDDEIKGTVEDTIDKIKKLDIDYNNITKEDIKNILYIVVVALIVAALKPIKKKINKMLK